MTFIPNRTVTVYKTADETKTSDVTLAIDGDLQVPLEASSLYFFRIRGYQDSDATPDMKVSVDYTGTFVSALWMYDLDTATGITLSFGNAAVSAGTAGLIRGFNIQGYVETTTAGNLGLYWSQNTSDAAATTLKKMSTLEVIKLS